MNYINEFKKKTLSYLIDRYNGQVKIGIVGVHRQALYLFALRTVLMDKIGESPITLENDVVLGMQGEIILEEGRIRYLEQPDKE